MNHAAHSLQQVNPDKLKARIEKDGVIDLPEAKRWYRYGNGEALEADFSKIDFSRVFPSDFQGNTEKYINLFFKGGKDAAVYGTIKLRNLGNNLVESASGYDKYDFDYQQGRFFRNVFTALGKAYNGSGKSYPIYFYGGAAYMGTSSPYYNPCSGNQCGRR